MKIILYLSCTLIFLACSSQSPGDSATNQSHADTASSVKADSPKNTSASNSDLDEAYTKAIMDYIQLVNQEYKIQFDTLLFGKHTNGQPTDFPDISLPEVIEGVHIKFVSTEQTSEKRDSLTFINLFGDVNPRSANFTFVTFLNGYSHSFDCYIEYELTKEHNELGLVNSRFTPFDNRDIKLAADKSAKRSMQL